jgi:hypothetical protein
MSLLLHAHLAVFLHAALLGVCRWERPSSSMQMSRQGHGFRAACSPWSVPSFCKARVFQAVPWCLAARVVTDAKARRVRGNITSHLALRCGTKQLAATRHSSHPDVVCRGLEGWRPQCATQRSMAVNRPQADCALGHGGCVTIVIPAPEPASGRRLSSGPGRRPPVTSNCRPGPAAAVGRPSAQGGSSAVCRSGCCSSRWHVLGPGLLRMPGQVA